MLRPQQQQQPPNPNQTPNTTVPVLQPSAGSQAATTPTTTAPSQGGGGGRRPSPPANRFNPPTSNIPTQTNTQLVVVNGVPGYYDAAGNFVPLNTGAPTTQEYFPEPRPATDLRFAPSGWTRNQGPYVFRGEGVVLAGGKILVDDQGQPRNYLFGDAVQEFSDMPTAIKNQFVNNLERKGFDIDDGRAQLNGLWYFMQLGNEQGVDWREALIRFDNASPDVAREVAAPRYNISNPSDIRTVANRVALAVLGRELTKEESDQFIPQWQQMELGAQQAGGGVVVSPPSIEIAAQEFAQRVAPTEANAYKYLGRVNTLLNSIGEI